ncbi:G-type lectin S-receptor-like serine/threonine-protein kinase At5g35370 [Lycium barbarum]|uniref:G-type lectin S-receptor-like serine/threonine-protein kinase At5g35370 n=1 Tax=Lycium barbarum TaxID=112863 RepID=UPI00293E44D8|nr:G-type lectin S-receptor-like serine/threonine-protein kinase At5g35370 [Lycium barbarum]
MEFILFFLILSLFSIPVFGFTLTEFVYPNFTASNLQFIDSTGSFLVSHNGTFKAAIFNPGSEQVNFYFCVIHVESNTIIWSANGDAPVSNSGIMRLTNNGINITEKDGSLKWSTPPLKLAVYAMQLTEAGNLLLLDQLNGTLWESFNHPTDTIVIGQKLRVGMMLSSAISGADLSKGHYRLSLTASDAMLQWQGLTYWKLSMETKAYANSNSAVEYMSVNQTGLYLFGQDGSVVVIMVSLLKSTFRIAKLDDSGQLIVISFVAPDIKQDFVGPVDGCRVPYVCGGLGVCTSGTLSDNPKCSCPANFNLRSHNSSSCVPSDSSYSLPVSCNSTKYSNLSNSSSMLYIRLGFGMDYFTTDFTKPFRYGANLSVCQNLCSEDCSCLGIFYANSSGSCYKLEDEIGSIMLRTGRNNDLLGFVKILIGGSTTLRDNDDFDQETADFSLVATVVLPFTGIFLLMGLALILWRRSRPQTIEKIKSKNSQPSSPYSEDLDAFSIPGLPVRFEYKHLQAATDNFKTQIGTGGFGAVYKGVLPDNTLVAVKKIISLSIQGQRDFCTEIAIIGSIHHINLVKLKGFCAQERQRLLVYEYMNRGSLDRTLFGNIPVLEWQERVEIALGSARGLAYLHSGCEQKIVHCDVKPENILLHDNFQAKISDFGLSKLLNREQSSLITTMRGTRGYLAPEWLTSSSISDKTDVYSFGMVLLEIVSGRKNCSPRTQSHSLDDTVTGDHSSSSSARELVYFPLFALEMHEQGRYLELADPKLEGRVSGGDIEKFVRVALCCVHEEPSLRPTMVSVVSMLEGEIPPTEPRMESLNFLRFYGRRFAEASTMEEAGGRTDVMLYPQANTSHTTSRSVSNAYFSYISSQQISGPR